MLLAPYASEFGLITSSVSDGTRPAAAFGTAVTPGLNTYGTAVDLVASGSFTHDAYGILINANSNTQAAEARATLLTIYRGGTAIIEHLSVACASTYLTLGGGWWYYFPLYIASGAAISAAASVNAATARTVQVGVKLFCKPSRPDMLKVGSFVQTFGANTAASGGTTTITAGTASEGAWSEIGTATRSLFYLEHAYSIDTATMVSNTHHVDLGVGDASSKKMAIHDGYFREENNESMAKGHLGEYVTVATGDKLYMRAQSGTNTGSNGTGLVYGVG